MPTIIDCSSPLSEILRQSTKHLHDEVRTSEGAQALVTGKLSKEDYILYLMMLWHVYDTLERGLETHASLPAIEPTYNPALLARTPALTEDITYLTQSPTWKSSALFKELTNSPPEALKMYISRIQEVTASDPPRLLAHAYVRYLGDLSGGQTVQRTLAKSYGLNDSDSAGLKFYEFNELGNSNAKANQGGLGHIKDWYRAGLNTASKDNFEMKEAILDESEKAFHFNAELLDFLATVPDPDDPNSPEHTQHRMTLEPKRSLTYSMTSFVIFILALSIAHFALIVGGFTGTRGYEKLVAVEGWLSAWFPFGQGTKRSSGL